MNNETEKDKVWIDELCDKIAEELANPKKVKYTSHKNRKLFTGNIVGMIKQAINTNMRQDKDSTVIGGGRWKDCITRPHANQSKGTTVLTEAMSARGDDICGVGPNADLTQKFVPPTK